jgi:hypothetical protein
MSYRAVDVKQLVEAQGNEGYAEAMAAMKYTDDSVAALADPAWDVIDSSLDPSVLYLPSLNCTGKSGVAGLIAAIASPPTPPIIAIIDFTQANKLPDCGTKDGGEGTPCAANVGYCTAASTVISANMHSDWLLFGGLTGVVEGTTYFVEGCFSQTTAIDNVPYAAFVGPINPLETIDFTQPAPLGSTGQITGLYIAAKSGFCYGNGGSRSIPPYEDGVWNTGGTYVMAGFIYFIAPLNRLRGIPQNITTDATLNPGQMFCIYSGDIIDTTDTIIATAATVANMTLGNQWNSFQLSSDGSAITFLGESDGPLTLLQNAIGLQNSVVSIGNPVNVYYWRTKIDDGKYIIEMNVEINQVRQNGPDQFTDPNLPALRTPSCVGGVTMFCADDGVATPILLVYGGYPPNTIQLLVPSTVLGQGAGNASTIMGSQDPDSNIIIQGRAEFPMLGT